MTRMRTTAPLLLAAGLAALAVATVRDAGCADPGHYVPRADGSWSLVGGCVAPGDLVVPPPPPPAPAPAPLQSRS
ncbi:hypothetical protein [Pseudonocardia phyllosphaerae]|uniref:hypothetical protein n=1 Tax=Pseudonocardia phyllosphaerae TaxID=3390502 RepID=UPI0039781CC0